MTARTLPPTPQHTSHIGPAELAARAAAVALAVASLAVFVIGTYFWTKVMTETFSPLGYAFTPVGMYGIAIVLIPLMGVIHRLWISGDLERKEGIAQAAERDRLRTSLLGAPPPGSLRNVHAQPPPENLIFGEDLEELRRRRREGS
ncbi:hypothetical protein [Patulibacter minatonensis]|uniref:hypothetical protein n=1 Tax=Patulibacter minatonensis TaxID=298163 RepID=UPI00047C47A5|nr:hypothetical protein [Patulibacter minatonensis]